MKGKLVIISAPSGAGKSTIVKHLLESGLNLSFSVSATTRAPRGNETTGQEYFFMTEKEFRDRINRDEFVEWEEVYNGSLYGTLKSELERIWSEGSHVLFDVDVEGGISLKRIFGKRSLAIFVMPPSVEELEKRLTGRGTDPPEKISIRVQKAHHELTMAGQFDAVIINDDLHKAKEESVRMVSDFLKVQISS
jgi:guanylate kinase